MLCGVSLISIGRPVAPLEMRFSRRLVTTTAASSFSSADERCAGTAFLTSTASPFTLASSSLPASRRSRAWRVVSCPETAGAVLPATSSAGKLSCRLACRASSLSAWPRLCAGMSIDTGAGATPLWAWTGAARAAARATARAVAKTRRAGVKRFVCCAARMGENSWIGG